MVGQRPVAVFKFPIGAQHLDLTISQFVPQEDKFS